MPIQFETGADEKYFISRYIGELSDKDLIRYYKDYFESNDWTPGSSELVDLTHAKLNRITNSGIENFIDFRISAYKSRGIESPIKISVYSDKDLSYGLARIYEGLTDEHLEIMKVFRTKDEAESWLTNQDQPTQ